MKGGLREGISGLRYRLTRNKKVCLRESFQFQYLLCFPLFAKIFIFIASISFSPLPVHFSMGGPGERKKPPTGMPSINILRSLRDVPALERNLGMVIEVPRVGDEGAYGRASNPTLALNPSRWLFVSDIHIIMPNIQQVYIVRSLQHKHYHCDKDVLERAIRVSGLKSLVLHVHHPTEDTLDHSFVKVINRGFDETSQGIISSIPWKSIRNTLYKETVVPSATEETKDPAPVIKRQQYFKDVGYTTGRCVILKDELGVSFPAVKPSDSDHAAAMAGLIPMSSTI